MDDPMDEIDTAWVVEDYEIVDDPPDTYGWAIAALAVAALLGLVIYLIVF